MTEERTNPQPAAAWRTSTRSSSTNCVEVGALDGSIAVRDSKDRGGPTLRFTPGSWREFLAAAKAGEFDLR
jgi:hypothetical protein